VYSTVHTEYLFIVKGGFVSDFGLTVDFLYFLSHFDVSLT